jgi:hypothetical protein
VCHREKLCVELFVGVYIHSVCLRTGATRANPRKLAMRQLAKAGLGVVGFPSKFNPNLMTLKNYT